jgi:hypothetical protein
MARRHQTAIRFEQSGSLPAITEPLTISGWLDAD